jgi:hypothetical protein
MIYHLPSQMLHNYPRHSLHSAQASMAAVHAFLALELIGVEAATACHTAVLWVYMNRRWWWYCC